MRRNILNKRGAVGEQLSIIYFLFLILIIGGSIALGISIFYSKGYDYRQVEADLLNYKVRQCILENDINDEFFKSEKFFETCSLNKEILEKNNIVKICDGFGDDCTTSDEPFLVLGSNFNICKIKSAEDDAFPKCSFGEINKDRKKFIIITGSNQVSRRSIE